MGRGGREGEGKRRRREERRSEGGKDARREGEREDLWNKISILSRAPDIKDEIEKQMEIEV